VQGQHRVPGLFHDKYRQPRSRHNVSGQVAQKKLLPSLGTVGTDHDQIIICGLGLAEDFIDHESVPDRWMRRNPCSMENLKVSLQDEALQRLFVQ
jgi:hypothetical protein